MIAATHLNDFASAALRLLGRRPEGPMAADPYERTPLTREEISEMFALDGLDQVQEIRPNALRDFRKTRTGFNVDHPGGTLFQRLIALHCFQDKHPDRRGEPDIAATFVDLGCQTIDGLTLRIGNAAKRDPKRVFE